MIRGSQSFGSRIQPEPTALSQLRDGLLLLALLVPFVAQAFPYGFPLFLPCAACYCMAALVCAGWSEGLAALRIGSSLFLAVMVLALLFFLYGVLLTIRWDELLLGESLNALAVLLLWVGAANSPWDAKRLILVVRRTISGVLWLSAALAALGLIKFALLLHGKQLAFIARASSDVYPWGTSLTSDYNMYALTMLAGVLAATDWMISRRMLVLRFGATIVLLLTLIAGFLSGSRRFWVVTPAAVLMLLVGAARTYGGKSILKGITLFVLVLVIVCLATSYQFGSIEWQKVGLTGLNLQARLSTLLDSDSDSGLDSRFIRWQFAFSLIDPANVWTGSGFDYLHTFGCKFDACRHATYPHNPVISGLLYAGIPGMLSVCAVFAYSAYAAIRLFWRSLFTPFVSTLMIVHLGFILISSNGPFAVKSSLTVTMMCALYLAIEKQSGTAQ